MSSCRFCSHNSDLKKVKIKGMRSFWACSKCAETISRVMALHGDEFERELTRLEADFTTPLDLLNLLYILPESQRKKGHNVRATTPRIAKYLDEYPQSHLFSSVLYEILIYIFLMLGLALFDPLGISWVYALPYVGIAFAFSFLCGVLILNTSATSGPCRKVFGFFKKALSLLSNSLNRIANSPFKNRWFDIPILLFLKIPLCLVIFIAMMIVASLMVVGVLLSAIIHAAFLFVLAYYIDYKRRSQR